MKAYAKVCKSLIKKNKSLTIGLLVMSILTIVVGVLGTNICASATASIIDYIDASNLPNRIYTTKLSSASKKTELLSIDGVKDVNTRFVSDCQFEIETDGIFSGNVISYDSSDLNKITFLEEAEVDSDAIKSYLPTSFAKRHNVEVGDNLTLYVKGIELKTVIKGIISSPETLFGDKDFMSVHEAYSYSSFYVDVNDLNKVLPINNIANQWLFYFESDLTESEKENVILQINDCFGENNIVSVNHFDNSKNNLLYFKPNLQAVEKVGFFFAILIAFITLGINFVFIQLIIKKEKKTIALLKALGYKKKHIVRLFCLYTLLINIPAIILGFSLGYLVLRVTLLKMEASFFLPLTSIVVNPYTIVALLSIVLLIGFASSFFASSQISKIEPCDIYTKNEDFGREPGKIIKNYKGNKFAKISFASMVRSNARQIAGALCIAACVLFMFVSVEGYASNSKVRTGGYGDRFTYDYVIRSIDDDSYEDIKDSIKSIEKIEPYIFIDAKTSLGSKRIAAIKNGNSMTTLRDNNNKVISPGEGIIIDQFTANRNNLKVGDSILVFDKEVKITGIAIEYINAVSYISFETANKLGFNSINGAMVKVKNGITSKDFTKDIFNLDSSIYVVKMSDQQAYLGERYTPIAVALVILGVLSFLVGAVLVANTAFMDFLELKNKYATLRSIGTPMKKIIQISFLKTP